MAQVEWTDQSLDDLEAIALLVAKDSPRYAEMFVTNAFKTVERLESFPLSGRIVPEFGSVDLREIIYGNYRIVYRVKEDEVEILTIHHGAKLLNLEKDK